MKPRAHDETPIRRKNTFSRHRLNRGVASGNTRAGQNSNASSRELASSPSQGSSLLHVTGENEPDHRRRRSASASRREASDSDDSVYSNYDFVNDVIQDIILNPSDDEDEVDGGTEWKILAPLTFFSSPSQRKRRRADSTSDDLLIASSPLLSLQSKSGRKKKMRNISPLLPKPGLTSFTLTVVLDVDETLLSARDGAIQLRPHIQEFIHACHSLRCEVIVWTAGATSYANTLFAAIAKACRMELWYHHAITRHHRWFDESENVGVKDLRRLQRDMDKLIIIENNPASIVRQPQNAILVEDYTEANDDDETFVVLTHIIQQLVPIVSPHPLSPAYLAPQRKKRKKNSSGVAVPAALRQISEVAPVMVGRVPDETSSFALWYSPSAAAGSARRYGDIEAV